MAVSISLSIEQNSQNIASNTSNVTVSVIAKWTYGSFNRVEKAGTLTIDGIKYSFSSTFNEEETTSGSQTLYSKTVNITHNSNGTKTLSCSASYTSGVSSGTVTTSASKVLTTIPRASSLTAGNGTLGASQTLTITRADSSFKHKITYTCGDVSGYAAGSSTEFTSATSILWTPPLSLANQNTSGTSVSVTLYLKTYTSGGTQIGSVTKTISCAIPASVKPSCTVAVTDPTGFADTYGSFIKGLSKFKVVVTPTTSYGSPIASYHITANGATYTAASFTTGVLKSSGNLTVNATVKDKRGRSGSASVTNAVIDYTAPVIVKLTVDRCNEDGTANEQGDYAKAVFTANVTSLNSKNTAVYVLKYKKSTEEEYTEVVLDELANNFAVTNQSYVFEADSGSSYGVELEGKDNFGTTKRATSVSTGFVLMHWKADGTGVGIGKISEESDLLDVGLKARFNSPVFGNVMGLSYLPDVSANSDMNDYLTTGSYAVKSNADAETIANIPVKIAGRLEVCNSTGKETPVSNWAYLRQKFIPYLTDYPTFERNITRNESNVWSYDTWVATSLKDQKILWSGAWVMNADHSLTLSEKVSDQPNGIVLVFSRYANGAAEDSNYNHFFVSKKHIAQHNGSGSAFFMTAVNFSYICAKYLYISNDRITGNANNSLTGTNNGVTFANNAYVLRYVIGV
jgi:hypothetical protein